MVGGPSIFFDRHLGGNETKLSIQEFQKVAKVRIGAKGLDATDLYLSCLMKEMPTGYCITTLRTDGERVVGMGSLQH